MDVPVWVAVLTLFVGAILGVLALALMQAAAWGDRR